MLIKYGVKMIKRLKGVRNTNKELSSDGVILDNHNNYDINNYNSRSHDISVPYIASTLSKICRFTGHIGSFSKMKRTFESDEGLKFSIPEFTDDIYSVAQHSIKMAEFALIGLGDPKLAMECLLHDAVEVLTGDIVSPIKLKFKSEIKPIENVLESEIMLSYGLEFPLDSRVKQIDLNMCEFEMTFLIKNFEFFEGYCMKPSQAAARFVEMFYAIMVMLDYDKKELVTDNGSHSSKVSDINKKDVAQDVIKSDMSQPLLITLNLGYILEEYEFALSPCKNSNGVKYYLVNLKEKTYLPVSGNYILNRECKVISANTELLGILDTKC